MAVYNETVRVRLTEGQLELLKRMSEQEELSVSEIIRDAVQDKLTLSFAS